MNEQESEWAGAFGSEYLDRSPGNVSANRAFFMKALGSILAAGELGSVIEFGAGSGANLAALRGLLPKAHLSAVEINAKAVGALGARQCADHISTTSILDWVNLRGPYDLSLSKGLLIHIPEADLPKACAALYKASRRYILIAEYFCPSRREIPYRGKRNMLWADDFAGKMLDAYDDLQLLNYGFVSKRDRHAQDDINWWLLLKGKL